MFQDLKDKRVIVTAAGGGIGQAIAEGFLAAGAYVHICDVVEAPLKAFQLNTPDLGVTVADVADASQVDALFEQALSHLGGLDILVNNAGIAGPTGPLESITPADWERALAVNLNGQFYCLRRAVPLLKEAGGGSIVNIASTAGLMGYPLRTPYAASKWAVVGLSKSLATEVGTDGIRVNAICPGSIDGVRMDRVIAAEAQAREVSPEQVRQGYLKQSSLRTFIKAADIANLTLFICSEAGAKISGQALSVDGNTETLTN